MPADNSHKEPLLANFKTLFYEKYETLEVPLAQVLDSESGIGFPATKNIGDTAHSSFLEDVHITAQNERKINAGNAIPWLQNKMESSTFEELRKGIQLNERDLIDLDDKIKQLPNSFSVIGVMISPESILLQSIGGAHANPLLGRFAYTGDKMNTLCEEFSNEEKRINEQVVFAEIIYCPEGRAGNIARRPALYDYEIPLLTSCSVGIEKQILLEDLMISVQQDEIILRSKRLNKRVIPRLSNAHNYTISSLPVYKFLASLQHQGKTGVNIYWGALANGKHFLPRLSYRKIILHPACWFLYNTDIRRILDNLRPFNELKHFFEKWEVPRFICLSEGDNELFIDTTNDSYLDILLEEIKAHQTVKLVEWLYEDLGEVSFIQQFILPLSKNHAVSIMSVDKQAAEKKIQRTFEPGSEWLYFKIYCGAHTSDKILSEVVKPATCSLVESASITKAFFIRYTDPHYHIRFRLHLTGKAKLAHTMNYIYNLLQPFCDNNLVWKVQLDTYQREIERYGESCIGISEELFYYDSLLYLNFIEKEEFIANEQIRFLCALKN
ncbi:MAG: thiopeptide-type bacteriocin biosynthesis protein, partial [Chitinophagaceae bacterium]